MIDARRPGTDPGYGTKPLLPKFRFSFATDQGIFGSGDNGYVSSSDQFERPQSVRYFRLDPCVARDHGDAEDFGLGRLDEQ